MNPDPKRVEAVFAAALGCATPEEQSALLDETCAGDAALRRRVEALLKAHRDASGFLQAPIAQPVDGEAPTLGLENTGSTSLPPGSMVSYFGDYELLGEVARGGMGVIFRARQVSLNRIVAVKMILAGQLASEQDVQRFHAKAQAAAKLRHANIVAIHEVGEHDGQHYFSMDYVEGRNLAELVHTSPLAPQQAARYVKVIADAIHYAHQQGVLHRDIKPSNVLIDRDDQPHVTDFGLARSLAADKGLTATGAVIGTPSYMPPEQASADRGQMGPHSDVYSLGSLLYELVTGRPPFRAATPLDTLMQVLNTEPAAPRLLNAAVARDLETIILKCLAKEPARRYATAQALSDDLQAFLDGKPIKARPRSLPERLVIWLNQQGRTFKIAAATIGGAALLLVAILPILEWRQQARMGAVEFETDGTALLVEVFEKDEIEPIVPPFTAPTRQPLRLPEGNYQMRLSSPYRLGETLALPVNRGETKKQRITLSERLLGEPLPCSGVFEFVPRGAGHDILSVVDQDTLCRYDGVTGKLQWTLTLGPDDQPVAPRAPGAQPRSGFFSSPWTTNILSYATLAKTPRLLPPVRNSDEGKVPDLIWVNYSGTALLALSGTEDLKFLWSFRPTPPAQDPARPAKPRYPVFGSAISFAPSGPGDPLVLALFSAGPDVYWAEGVDARTGRSVWRYALESQWFSDENAQPYWSERAGPWVLKVDGRSILVCLAGSRLIGLDPQTGAPAWKSVDLGFVPVGTPTFADLDGDGRLDMVVRGPKFPSNKKLWEVRGPDQHMVRAVSLPAGQILWTHDLPDSEKWSTINPGSTFLPDPLPIDLDGDGKAEVIVPGDQRGTIAVLEGPTGAVRWRSTVAITQGIPLFPRFLVGPDLDGDGCRDLFVANVVTHIGYHFQSVVRVQALSGKTGAALWRTRFPLAKETGGGYIESGLGVPLASWQRGRDGWPLLVVPGRPHTLVLEASTGKVAHLLESLRGPYRVSDLDGDGVPELIGYQFTGNNVRDPGRLHRFRGIAMTTAAPTPVTPQAEAIEWVDLPWVNRPLPGSSTIGHIPGVMLSLVFLSYVGFRVWRSGWRGLWLPVIVYVLLVIYQIDKYRGVSYVYEPWQQYRWDGWYEILYIAMLAAGDVTLMWLGIVACFRLGRALCAECAGAC